MNNRDTKQFIGELLTAAILVLLAWLWYSVLVSM